MCGDDGRASVSQDEYQRSWSALLDSLGIVHILGRFEWGGSQATTLRTRQVETNRGRVMGREGRLPLGGLGCCKEEVWLGTC